MTEPIIPAEQPDSPTSYGGWFLQLVYDTLFCPLPAWRAIAKPSKPSKSAFIVSLTVIVLISALAPLIYYAYQGPDGAEALAFSIPLGIAAGLATWGFTALVVDLPAFAYTGTSRLRTFLTLSGLATLPWLFLGPLSIFRNDLGGIGLAISLFLTLLTWLWSVVLFGMAIAITYRLTIVRTLILLSAPFGLVLILAGWLTGFIGNVRQLLLPH